MKTPHRPSATGTKEGNRQLRRCAFWAAATAALFGLSFGSEPCEASLVRRQEAPASASVRVLSESPTVYRETPSGRERLIELDIANSGSRPLEHLSLLWRAGGKEHARELLDVRAGGSSDAVWIPAISRGAIAARLVQGGRELWRGNLTVPPPAPERVVIPRSPCVKVADLKPLTLRGTNFYPRSQPWAGLWREMDEKDFEAEFAEMDRLNVNTIRTFFIPDEEKGLNRKDGAFTPLLLSRIDTMLRVAARHRVKTMLCLMGGGGAPMSDLNYWRRYFRTCLEPFAYDGRILMWDLINEPGGNDGPKAKPELAAWMKAMYAFLKQEDAGHMATVGLTWQFDQLWDLGVIPDAGQYHNYSGAFGVQPVGQPAVRNVADDLRNIRAEYTKSRPLIIGEFGLYGETGEEKSDTERRKSEAHQADIYRWVLQGAEAAGIAGVYNWTAFQFVPNWMGRKEQTFGVIRPDGSLKPAGVILRDTFARWRAMHRAPWERP